ncbi:hypothetical protein ARTHRO9AX_80043 [Arthrobacter sp. 9AX]|nr:hypothetical protein ARTHRO9AX_80043 [Arthrobacter sp. 9AX]
MRVLPLHPHQVERFNVPRLHAMMAWI